MRLVLLALLLPPPSPASPPIVFSDATTKAGLASPRAALTAHGGASGAFGGAGRVGLCVGGACVRPSAEYAPAPGPVSARLFRNKGDGTFERVAQPAVEFFARTSGAVFADLDNNGTLELYAANNANARSRKTDEPQHSAQLRRSILFR